MKYNYTTNENYVITNYHSIPFKESEPYFETDLPIYVGYSKVINGKFYQGKYEYEQAMVERQQKNTLKNLRHMREKECFSIINRGMLWYNTLTEEQKQELQEWYHAWLDVTTTKVVPDKPSWL